MTGDAGVGKTKALHKYIEDHPHDSVMITINPCTKSTKAVLKLLALSLGVPVYPEQGGTAVLRRQKAMEYLI